MHFNHDGRASVKLGAALVNDRPGSADELQRRCESMGLSFSAPITGADLTQVQAFLQDWLTVVEATAAGERAQRLNILLDRYAGPPHLTDHARDGWHLHFRSDDVTGAHQIAVLICVGTAMHLTGRGMSRLGRCAEEGCPKVYADISRNGRQQYCSPTCGNRAAARRHRSRAAS